MLNYKKRIVFTGGTGRFAKAFKLKEKSTKYNFFFPKKTQLNILNEKSLTKYLKNKRPKYLIHLAGNGKMKPSQIEFFMHHLLKENY